MKCPKCSSTETRKFGSDRKGFARHQCRDCKRTFTEPHNKPLGGMYTQVSSAEEVLKLLVEGSPSTPLSGSLVSITEPVMGRPDPEERLCTSIVDRSNLSIRMGIRRFTRLTNAFSKKWENHWAAVSLWYCFCNFCRIHKSLRIMPAMAAGITPKVWSLGELLEAA